MSPSPHLAALAAFFETDRLRLESALERVGWTEPVAARVTDFLRLAALVQGEQFGEPPGPAELDAIRPASAEDALALVERRFTSLLAAAGAAGDEALSAPSRGPRAHGLTVEATLYDLARASATLLGWLSAQPDADAGLDAWFEEA